MRGGHKKLQTPKGKYSGLEKDGKKNNLGGSCGRCHYRIDGCFFHVFMLPIHSMKVHQIPARKDNYIYILDDPHLDHCAVIDATDFSLIDNYCTKNSKTLSAIFVTHHHDDHIHGLHELCQKYHCPIYGFAPDHYRIPDISHFVQEDDEVFYGPNALRVLETPGHTLGHISYYSAEHQALFCGDVIFRFGCGRLFEGTAEQTLHSLKKFVALPAQTQVFCAHEYTLSNLRFCMDLEPNNSALLKIFRELQEQRARQQSTVPFTLGEQIALSPFLRWQDKELKKILALTDSASELEVFTEVRQRRNRW